MMKSTPNCYSSRGLSQCSLNHCTPLYRQENPHEKKTLLKFDDVKFLMRNTDIKYIHLHVQLIYSDYIFSFIFRYIFKIYTNI